MALQLARLLPPQAPAKITVAVITTIQNSYLSFLLAGGCHPRLASLGTSAN
jgi:hypothetical protein